ncbi:MAG: HNH endonuclease signature motif containing protein [Pseudomonadota bacterium]
MNPLCEVCDKRGLPVAASHVDHKVAISKGGDPFPPLDALMSMCPSCHSIKTSAIDRSDRSSGSAGVAFKGCGLDGLPLDPSHPFMGRGGSKDGSSDA